LDDSTLLDAIRNLGGHDIPALVEALSRIDDNRPTVILAYTIKGYGLPSLGHPQNHSSLLSTEEYEEFASRVERDPEAPWARFDPATPTGGMIAEVAKRLERTNFPPAERPELPEDFG